MVADSADVDTVFTNGTSGDDLFSIAPGLFGARVTDGVGGYFEAGPVETLRVNGSGGNDTITGANGLAALLPSLVLDGGSGNDTIAGGDGADTILAGGGTDVVDSNRGNDAVFLGGGNDTAIWDPGDDLRQRGGDTRAAIALIERAPGQHQFERGPSALPSAIQFLAATAWRAVPSHAAARRSVAPAALAARA